MSRRGGHSSANKPIRNLVKEQEDPNPAPDEQADGDKHIELDMANFSPQSRHTPRKRPKTSAARASTNFSLLSPNATPPTKSESPVKIKSEAETRAVANLQLKSPDQRVTIYVGKANTTCEVGLEDLHKSPILKSLVSNIGTKEPFIMHPELTKISADHFGSVREFLLIDEYMPALVHNSRGKDVLPKRLDGCSSVKAYHHQALRNGHLYVIAGRLSMRTMQGLIYRKITEAEDQPYGIECLLNLAMTIFSRPDESQHFGNGNLNLVNHYVEAESEGKDVLEEWLIRSLGNRFQPMMTNHAELFFHVANHDACAARGFGVRVLRRKVDFWNTVSNDIIAIEDDD